MRLRICSLLGVAVALVSLAGCQKRASFDPALAGAFFPLRPGSSWTYRFTDKSRNTTEIITDRVIGIEHLASPKAAGEVVSEYSGPDGTGASTNIYVVEGGYITRASTERQFLPRLLKPDLTWSNSLFPFGDLANPFQVLQKHHTFLEPDEVVVPAGRFSGCIRIETDAVYQRKSLEHNGSQQFRYLDWYAPNVGLVKTLFLMKSGFFGFETEISRLELLKFAESPVLVTSRSPKAEASMPSPRPTEEKVKE